MFWGGISLPCLYHLIIALLTDLTRVLTAACGGLTHMAIASVQGVASVPFYSLNSFKLFVS